MPKYSDIKTNLDVHPIKGDLVLLEDADAIKRSIRNILLTRPGEWFYDNLDFGGGLDDFLFDHITPEFNQVVEDQIRRACTNYEPRAIVNYVSVEADEAHNAYSAKIVFTPRNLPTQVTLTVLLSRIR